MSRATVLARARAAAETGMVDTCQIRRKTGETTDDNTGVTTPTWSTVYTGRCRVQQRALQAQQHEPGEDVQLLASLEVQLPMSAAAVRDGDEVTITASPRDAQLVGLVFLVRGYTPKTDASARRVPVTRRTS